MTKPPSIFDGKEYLYAEQLTDGKPTVLTIKAVNPITITGEGGRTNKGFELLFNETDKKMAFASAKVCRQLAGLFGTDYREYAGNKVELYTEPSAKSPSGRAIRIRQPTAKANERAGAILNNNATGGLPE